MTTHKKKKSKKRKVYWAVFSKKKCSGVFDTQWEATDEMMNLSLCNFIDTEIIKVHIIPIKKLSKKK